MPPIPSIEMAVDPIMPFITPSVASSIMAVTMPDEVVIPRVIADCDSPAARGDRRGHPRSGVKADTTLA
ncbi:hypothetical protein [Anaeromyxobacter sp. K]|uniref:hypothetical protein n=1 Tax=Anaeromyxobacter sp. (strain K) TaxID=447217 RepID=UPI001E5B89AE|nr:hypothetical protein [Anaeromyxobacter sp. K]